MVFARRLAPDHDLLLIARRKERLEALAAELRTEHGSTVAVLQADLSEEHDLFVVAERIASESRLALLVNNAGFGTRGMFWAADLATQEKMHRLHIAATLRLTHCALQGMMERNFGAIINVASVAAFLRRPGSVSYGATKSWMTAFTEGLYLELKNADSLVRVQALCPGYTYSEFHDVMNADRTKAAPDYLWLRAEDVVEASLKGLSRGKLFVVPGWQYKTFVSLVSKLPNSLRLAIEAAGSRGRRRSS